MSRAIAFLGVCNKYLCGALMAMMILVVFANTMMRYLFHSGIIMGEEVVRYMFVWSIYLAIISVYYRRQHITVTTLVDWLKPRTAAAFSFVADFGALYALFILLQGSVMYFEETTNMGQATGLPYKVMVVPIIIASACCLCIVIADMIKQLRIVRSSAA